MKQISDFLRNFREKKGLTEKDIIDRTTLTSSVIHLIENGDFKSIGAEFYIKNFLGQYCRVIGLTDSETNEIIQQVLKGISGKNSVEIKTVRKRNGLVLWFFIILALFFTIFIFISRNKKVDIRPFGKKQEPPMVQKERRGKLKLSVTQSKKLGEKKSLNKNREYLSQKRQIEIAKKSEEKVFAENITQRDEQGLNLEKKVSNNTEKDNPPLNETGKEDKAVIVKFKARCMCWVNIAYKNKVIKDFILKENESFTIKVPAGSVLTIGNAGCLTLYFNNRLVKLKGQKVLRNLTVE